jgi:transcriptional regulator with XRE-family HTH domain
MIAKKELMPMDKHVGARVRMRRMELGMSQATLGIRLGLTFQQVQKYEKGWNRIGASRLSQIAEILEVPVSWFFEGGEFAKQANAAQGEDPIAMLSTSDGMCIAKCWHKLKPKARRALANLVQQMTVEAEA